MSELLPCPFCGGKAHTYKNNLWHVACERAHNGCVTMSAFVTEAEAVTAWNSRAERTCRNEWAEFGKFRCSECWTQVDAISTNTTQPMPIKHCPICGAKVVG